jgi:hypothetical protein
MWVLITKKIPCEVSPPKMSVFWSTPWPHREWAERQAEKNEVGEKELVPTDKSYAVSEDAIFGLEPNWNGARRIRFDDKDVRIFPHEFSPIPPERLRLYLDEGVFELISEGVASEQVINDLMEGDKRVLWEHALVDGCTDSEARMVALGMDISIPDAEIPPVGWFRCKKEFARFFCEENEMVETRTHAPPMPVAKSIAPEKKTRVRKVPLKKTTSCTSRK